MTLSTTGSNPYVPCTFVFCTTFMVEKPQLQLRAQGRPGCRAAARLQSSSIAVMAGTSPLPLRVAGRGASS